MLSAAKTCRKLLNASAADSRVLVTSPSVIAPGVSALTRGVTPSMLSKSTVMASLLAGGIALAGLGTAT